MSDCLDWASSKTTNFKYLNKIAQLGLMPLTISGFQVKLHENRNRYCSGKESKKKLTAYMKMTQISVRKGTKFCLNIQLSFAGNRQPKSLPDAWFEQFRKMYSTSEQQTPIY
jgi:hypothetical protein